MAAAVRTEPVRRGAVRCPSEHHEGKASRVVPIFAELRPYLDEVWEQAEPGAEFVITRYRQRNVNLRTQLERIIGRAGLQPWPKLWHNLRASRQTELAQTFPLHVVCESIGNTERVGMEHYLRVTDADIEKAATMPLGALQNPVQQSALPGAHKGTGPAAADEKTAGIPSDALPCASTTYGLVPPDGLEPSIVTL